jgi:hypothetical protein
MLKRWITVTVALLALAITASAAVASGGLSGTYKAKITKPASIKGVWEIKFASGRDTIILNGKVGGHGHYTISGSTLTFRPKGTCHSPGKYKFKMTGTKVKFTKISDPCPSARPRILQRTWTKV